AKTSVYYAIAPFIGVALSLIIFREIPNTSFIIALFMMIAGTYFASTDKKETIVPSYSLNRRNCSYRKQKNRL
ncbi:MAG: hypothetical protein RR387_06925, partial [Clostridiales bacterium]